MYKIEQFLYRLYVTIVRKIQSMSVYSLIEYFGRQHVNSCGYCKTEKGHSDYGMWLHFLTVFDYQNLIDRGWRRSGLYGYKPVMIGACCALYTIRCDAVDLRLTRSQKKLIKRFNRFIVYGERRKCHSGDTVARRSEEIASPSIKPSKSVPQLENLDIEKPGPCCSASQPTSSKPDIQIIENSDGNKIDKLKASISNPRRRNKKKTLRYERAKARIMSKGKTEEEAIEILKSKKRIQAQKTIEELLTECEKPNAKHKLEVKLVLSSPPNDEFEKTFNEEYELYRKYQMIVHKDEPDKCTMKQFRRFLVASPLQPQLIDDFTAPVGYFGSYHQQYWLDGKLIAVGVIDILPYCVSSVYFFYDPDYNDLALGSYGSMKELLLARQLHTSVPSVQFYYMGFYIHTCPKMKYKARISPSYLLCPETYTFQPIEHCLEKITKYGVCRLHPDPTATDECYVDSTNQVMIRLGHSVMPYRVYCVRYNSTDQEEVKEFAQVVGQKCVDSILLLRTS